MGDIGLSGLYGLDRNNRDSSRRGGGTSPMFSARTKDIILDQSHKFFTFAGEWNAIGAIMFESVKSPTLSPSNQTVSPNPIFAYPLFPNIKHYPLLEEIVMVFFLPDSNVQQNSTSGKYYYFPPINVWSSQVQNAIPGIDDLPVSQTKTADMVNLGSPNIVDNTVNSVSLGSYFTEGEFNPLIPYEGDVIYEGRFGNSIRFSSTTQGAIPNQWSSGGTIPGSPILILRNGQAPTSADPWQPTAEDINNDNSSIYLTKDQQLPLFPASVNNYSFSKSTPPTNTGQYIGDQIILNSGRLVFNAKSDSILILANKSIQLSCNETLGVDAKQISLTADEIYLGSSEGTKIQPIVLGENLNFVLSDIATFFQTLNIAFKSAVDSNGAPIVSLQSIASDAEMLSNDILNIVNAKNLLSKTVKTI
jgi:hypothetical protein